MHPLLKIFLKISVALVAIFFLSRPYNWYCQLTQNCQTFYFSRYFPKKEGAKEIQTIITTQTKFRDIDFYADQSLVKSVTNRKNIVKFTFKNNSKKIKYIFPKMTVTPVESERYLTKYESPSLQTYRLKPKEVLIVNFEFEIDKSIEDEEEYRADEDGLQIDFRI